MIRAFLLPLVILLPSRLAAQDSAPISCDRAVTTMDMRRCASRALEQAKRDLSRYIEEARRLAANRALLDSAQAAWERFREMTCRAAGSQREGGTMKPVVVLNCLLDLTRRRLREVYDDYLRTSTTVLPEPKR
jgi:uncharacterized protein YecT (DUF1311 family)